MRFPRATLGAGASRTSAREAEEAQQEGSGARPGTVAGLSRGLEDRRPAERPCARSLLLRSYHHGLLGGWILPLSACLPTPSDRQRASSAFCIGAGLRLRWKFRFEMGVKKQMSKRSIGPIIAVWVAIGAGIGVAMRAATDNMGMRLAVGVGIGAAVGAALDSRRSSPVNDREDESNTDSDPAGTSVIYRIWDFADPNEEPTTS